MKKSFKTLVVIAAAAFTLASCEKQEVNVPSTSERTITLNFNAMPFETKTAFGEKEGTTYPTLWTETSTVQASLNFASVVSGTLTPSSDNKSATFSATFKVPETAPEEYVIYALSPKFLGVSPNNSTISFEIPTSQSPTEASVDEAAQFVFGSTTLTALPDPDDPDAETKKSTVSPIDISFSHLTAYGKMTIKDEAVVAAGIKSISLTASKPIAGRWNYAPADGSYSENSPASSITLETTSAEGIWFAIAPTDLSAGTLKVTVTTEDGTYEKTIDFTGTGKGNFKAGTVASFGVKNFTKVEDVVYNLVTDVTDLTPNSVVIIAAAASNVAISTTQNGNNRASTGVSKNDNGDQILNPGDAVETFLVETGAASGTYAFNAQKTAGYIYAAGGTANSNWLKTKEELDVVSSWKVTIAETGVATIKCADATVVRHTLRYNTSSDLFSCYASGQQDVAIYKLEGSGDEPVEPVTIFPEQTEVSFPAAGGTSDEIFIDFDGESCDLTASVDVSWITLQSETIVDGDGVIFTVAENTTSVERTGVITLSAPTIVPATITVTQEAGEGLPVLEVTVADFIAADPSVDQKYQLTGTITSIASSTYGNLYIEDETGSVYVYGLCATEQGLQDGATASSAKANNDKSFSNLGLKVGDVLTLIGYRYTYNTTIQVLGGYYVSHVSAVETPTFTPASGSVTAGTSIEISCATEGASIYYTLDESEPTTASTLYTGPIVINETTTVKAIAVKEGMPNSGVATALYTVGGNDGLTPETAYTASEAYAAVAALASGGTMTNMYVKGTISSIRYTFSAQFGTATFNISDDGTTSGSQFTCYSLYYFNNAAWVEGNTQIAVGDEVIVYGTLINYNGKTPETSSKNACLYSLNGATE